MGWFSRRPESHDIIDVQMYDASSDELIARSEVPADQLPASFEAETTMHLGPEDWLVVEARPMTAEEFRKTGKLILRVSKCGKLGTMDPNDILFSLATINDGLFGIAPNTTKLGKDVLEIAEDDVRQIEFIATSQMAAIEQEMESIREIHQNARREVGFTHIHVRNRILQPLEGCNPTIREILRAIPRSVALDGFGYFRSAGLVIDGFAIRFFSSLTLYGTHRNGRIDYLCLAHGAPNNAGAQDFEKLAAVAAKHDLLLVDWCRGAVIPPVLDEYAAYFAE
jgi:hypothetical protein